MKRPPFAAFESAQRITNTSYVILKWQIWGIIIPRKSSNQKAAMAGRSNWRQSLQCDSSHRKNECRTDL